MKTSSAESIYVDVLEHFSWSEERQGTEKRIAYLWKRRSQYAP